jgi:hypothetical protein
MSRPLFSNFPVLTGPSDDLFPVLSDFLESILSYLFNCIFMSVVRSSEFSDSSSKMALKF